MNMKMILLFISDFFCHLTRHFLLYNWCLKCKQFHKLIQAKRHKDKKGPVFLYWTIKARMSISTHRLRSQSLSSHVTKWIGIKALPRHPEPGERELSVTVLFEEWGRVGPVWPQRIGFPGMLSSIQFPLDREPLLSHCGQELFNSIVLLIWANEDP
ncbi:hypothetical protein XENOCAPTIV_003516 [Xenoophorus captivus]|uniref:Uncharacterized protein n=1 Tax=Xenoophorus captivus TaxID=1517983 RepID=A0ABV0QY81_9TELE